jgi:hypothetical protein
MADDDETGAVDLKACFYQRGRCRCGKCAICGHQMHMAIHGPSYGEQPGSKPWGHRFQPVPRIVRA